MLACSPAGGRGMRPPWVVALLYGPLMLRSTYTPACSAAHYYVVFRASKSAAPRVSVTSSQDSCTAWLVGQPTLSCCV